MDQIPQAPAKLDLKHAGVHRPELDEKDERTAGNPRGLWPSIYVNSLRRESAGALLFLQEGQEHAEPVSIARRDCRGDQDTLGTVRHWITMGKLASVRPGRRRLVRRTDLDAFLAASAMPNRFAITATAEAPNGLYVTAAVSAALR
jgi:excisionase family DNA binding protein